MRLFKRKPKFLEGYSERRRRTVLMGGIVLVLLVIVLVPWQGFVLHGSASIGTRMGKTLLGKNANTAQQKAGPSIAPEIPHLPDAQHSYGMAIGQDVTKLDQPALDKLFGGIQYLGAEWLRFEIQWQIVQPDDPSEYDWSAYDRAVKAASAHHLKLMAYLDSPPIWAEESCISSQCPPKNFGQFAAFAATATQHFAPLGLQVWEVWSEPNDAQSWGPKANPGAYTSLLQQTYTVIKLANPRATVISGGLSPEATDGDSYSELDFTTHMYQAGAKNYFDALGDHPYSYPLLPSHNTQQAWSRMSQTGSNLRAIMAANGDSAKKIWITEFGAPTNGPGQTATEENYRAIDAGHVDEALQSDMLSRGALLYASYDWVGPMFWYTYQDAGNDAGSNRDFFGLIRSNGSHKPSYDVFKRLTAAARR